MYFTRAYKVTNGTSRINDNAKIPLSSLRIMQTRRETYLICFHVVPQDKDIFITKC